LSRRRRLSISHFLKAMPLAFAKLSPGYRCDDWFCSSVAYGEASYYYPQHDEVDDDDDDDDEAVDVLVRLEYSSANGMAAPWYCRGQII
jgi:hypothetical protein